MAVEPRTFFLIGAGKVGMSIARAAVGSRWRLLGVQSRTAAEVERASRLLSVPCSCDLDVERLRAADLVLMPVVDDQVVAVSRTLAATLSPRQCLVHTSGSLASAAMASPLMHAHLASCHPLQALANPDGSPDKLREVYFAVEGDPVARTLAAELAVTCGGRPVDIDPAGKVLYHAAAVMAANFLTVLVDAASELTVEAGVADTGTAVAMLLPLLEGTVDNLRATREGGGRPTLAATMTGPVRRGDVGTVDDHLHALHRLADRKAESADLPNLYAALTRRAVTLAAEAGLDPQTAQRFAELVNPTRFGHQP